MDVGKVLSEIHPVNMVSFSFLQCKQIHAKKKSLFIIKRRKRPH